jgi:hypothetical protein
MKRLYDPGEGIEFAVKFWLILAISMMCGIWIFY